MRTRLIFGAEPEKIDKWLASIRQMAHSAAAEVQNHYSETLAAISRMLVSDVDNADEGCRGSTAEAQGSESDIN
jgi:hypothetical protein